MTIFERRLAEGVAALSEFRQNGDDAIENLFRFGVVFARKPVTDLQDVLNRRAFTHRARCNLEESPPMGHRGLAIALDTIQGDRLRWAEELILGTVLIALEARAR